MSEQPEWMLTHEEQRAIASELPKSSAFGAARRQEILDAQLLAQTRELAEWGDERCTEHPVAVELELTRFECGYCTGQLMRDVGLQ